MHLLLENSCPAEIRGRISIKLFIVIDDIAIDVLHLDLFACPSEHLVLALCFFPTEEYTYQQ